MEKYKNKIAVLIPAYNEEERIGAVLDLVTQIPFINQIVVVNDGSKDKTAQVAEKYPKVLLVSYSYNKGKAFALREGLKVIDKEITLFLDADLIGLTIKHVKDLATPVVFNRTTTTVGNFQGGRLRTDVGQILWGKDLSGQRAAKTEFWLKVFNEIDDKEIEKLGFGIEQRITSYIKTNKVDVEYILLEGLTHIMKEEKNGMKGVFGKQGRIQMYWDIGAELFVRRPSRWFLRQFEKIKAHF